MAKNNNRYLGFLLVGIWVVFTVSLVTWWMIFGLQQVDRLALLDSKDAAELTRFQKMLLLEGATMILSLVAGGSALFYYLYRQIKEANRLKTFFASFTHEIKTPIASASLKLDMLDEKLENTAFVSDILKVKQELQRLTMQIENSLFLADESSSAAILSSINIREFINNLSLMSWKGIESIDINGEAIVLADQRMLETIVGNIFRNASQHGKASRISVVIEEKPQDPSSVYVSFADNGLGFKGDSKKLTELFTRHYSGSGSGIGLYLVNKLSKVMGGSVSFLPSEKGFCVMLKLKADHSKKDN